ncbi:MAG TPA: pyrroline-5-carboxylate reductase [Mycobacterium sp.]|nr:pyrroline-5-carboxylate reductase [Mycobacterium sp.]
MTRIAIVGAGSMGEALLSGFLRSEHHQVKDMAVAEQQPDRARYIADTYKVSVRSVAEAVETAEIVIIAVKPGDVDTVIAEIAKIITAESGDSPVHLLVPIVAGVTTGYLESKLPAGIPVVRVMPNTPAQVGVGASVLSRGRFASQEQLDAVRELFECVGTVQVLPEEQMDAVTAVSGSGPAYFFLLAEALVDAAVGTGLNRQAATELAAQTMAGAAAMLAERLNQDRLAGAGTSGTAMNTTPAQLRASVTSPGGTTAAALRELERGGLRTTVDAAVRAAKTRSEQLILTSE